MLTVTKFIARCDLYVDYDLLPGVICMLTVTEFVARCDLYVDCD